jgi:N-acetylmuramoyl-L-alanine amidase
MRLLPDAVYHPSPNIGGPLTKPTLIVLHYTAGRNVASSVQWLSNPKAKASAHLVIGRAGEVFQLIPFDRVAWHAGESKWGWRTGVNKFSIGIELDNPGWLLKNSAGFWRSPTTGVVYQPEDIMVAKHKSGGPERGWLLYTPAQTLAAARICQHLVATFPSITEIAGHDDVSPGRKIDPGPAWDMDSFRTDVFGRA